MKENVLQMQKRGEKLINVYKRLIKKNVAKIGDKSNCYSNVE